MSNFVSLLNAVHRPCACVILSRAVSFHHHFSFCLDSHSGPLSSLHSPSLIFFPWQLDFVCLNRDSSEVCLVPLPLHLPLPLHCNGTQPDNWAEPIRTISLNHCHKRPLLFWPNPFLPSLSLLSFLTYRIPFIQVYTSLSLFFSLSRQE